MSAASKTPLIAGVTGHRRLRAEDEGILRAAVREELKKLQAACPHTPIRLMCSFAEGGDQLCAGEARSLGIGLIGALPMEREEFRRDFTGAALERFDAFCAASERLIVPPFTEQPPTKMTRDFLYRQCGIFVSARCHVLLALWDGEAGTPDGCGTAEAVGFMLQRQDAAVLHVRTPRAGAMGTAGTVTLLGDADAFRDRLQQIDAFNGKF